MFIVQDPTKGLCTRPGVPDNKYLWIKPFYYRSIDADKLFSNVISDMPALKFRLTALLILSEFLRCYVNNSTAGDVEKFGSKYSPCPQTVLLSHLDLMIYNLHSQEFNRPALNVITESSLAFCYSLSMSLSLNAGHTRLTTLPPVLMSKHHVPTCPIF